MSIANDFLKGCKTTQEGRTVLQFTRLGPQDVHRQMREAGPLPHTICKTELKIKHLSVRAKTTTLRRKRDCKPL